MNLYKASAFAAVYDAECCPVLSSLTAVFCPLLNISNQQNTVCHEFVLSLHKNPIQQWISTFDTPSPTHSIRSIAGHNYCLSSFMPMLVTMVKRRTTVFVLSPTGRTIYAFTLAFGVYFSVFYCRLEFAYDERGLVSILLYDRSTERSIENKSESYNLSSVKYS
ncbi:hypothetical protein NPIL_448431 [Nephila pilipes]|uniref:Uncharacterized protein n=1 Tax=Nephila pilipes TaxID=299642 RepID=A0A8X6ME27_NEPPI|nr:hypothetical protein NPIL_448431 [Nephila pilipes]